MKSLKTPENTNINFCSPLYLYLLNMKLSINYLYFKLTEYVIIPKNNQCAHLKVALFN